MKAFNRLFSLLLVAIFLCLSAIGLHASFSAISDYENMDCIEQAWIIDCVEDAWSNDDDVKHYSYNYTYEFEANGVLYQRTSMRLKQKLFLGDMVVIRYRSDNPEDSRMNLEHSLDVMLCVVMIIVILCLFIVLVAFIGWLRKRK